MSIGPIQLLAIGFEDFEPSGHILTELNMATEAGSIRLIDLQFVRKDPEGRITSMEMSGLSPAETIEFGAVIGGLLGMGAGGPEGAEVGVLSGAMAAAERSYGLTPSEVQSIADDLPPGGAAALLAIEHTWATGFRDAVAEAGGELIAQGFLTPQALFMVGAEIEAAAEAMAAIEAADAVKLEAAREAARAVALSEAIKAEAAREAVTALIEAELIEEAAIEEAAAVVAMSLAIEEAAIEEAAAVVAAAEEVKAAADESSE